MIKSIFSKINMFREKDNPLYGASVTEIAIDDEAVGTFISITQHQDNASAELRFDIDEIDMLCTNLKFMKKIAEGLDADI